MVITVQCPACASSFPVDTNKIPVKGVNVRCSTCAQIFRIERPPEPAAAPTPPAPEPEPEPEAPTLEAAAPEPVIDEAPRFEAPSFDAGDLEVEDAGRDRDVDAESDFSIGAAETAVEETPSAGQDDWVFEREEEIDPGSLDIETVDTVQSQVEEAKSEASFFGGDTSGFETSETPVAPDEQEPMVAEWPTEDESETSPEESTLEIAAPEPTIVPPAEPEPPSVGAFTFGKRDPKDKARRLARVLVSDMIMYNPDRHERALANGTLKADFEDEIQKSWKEYVEQVGEEMATENDFWTEALNDVLARGEKVF